MTDRGCSPIIPARESIKNWVPENLKWAPITFGPGKHHGVNTVRMYRVNKAADTSFVPITEYQSFAPLF